MAYHVIPQHLSIRAMRSSGYRDAAHAVAELIDNSIQAGELIEGTTEVEVVCVDRSELVSQRRVRRINEIAVFDNASGMDPETLRMALQFGVGTHLKPEEQTGMGKFGMGLPNASISQCRRVDVWSWQQGRCFRTHIDVSEIESGQMVEIPEPEPSSFPEKWLELVRAEPGDHGTLVVWRELDRITWKRSAAFLKNAEFLVGRMYRNFVRDNRVRIRLSAFEDVGGSLENEFDSEVRPNDPLYVTTGTNAPPPFHQECAFDEFGEGDEVEVSYNGGPHTVRIRYSITKPQVRELGGNSEIGKHVAKNQGVSLLRAGRELEMNRSFEIGYDPRERWWGIEVSFDPALDDIFGVTNNKQAATAFYEMDLDEDAAGEDMSPTAYRQMLEENNDPRLPIFEISARIRSQHRTLREQITRMREGSQRARGGVPGRGSAEGIATEATRRRQERLGLLGRSDEDESLPPDQRTHDIAEELVEHGVPPERADEIAVAHVGSNIKFLFQNAEFPGQAIFDIRSRAGTIIVTINMRHPAHEHLFELLRGDDDDETGDSPALTGLKLLLTAWARMEDEAGDRRRQELEDIRAEWGRIARDFLQVADD